MNILIRTDCSPQAGYGHFMRCLTLADQISKDGAKIEFLIENNSKKFIPEKIEAHGHRYRYVDEKSPTEDTIAKIKKISGDSEINWFILDHYEINSHLEKLAHQYCKNILTLDDAPKRKYFSSVLLDQNAGRTYDDYVDRIGENCTLLIGPTYALIRDEFRKKINIKNIPTSKIKISISLGGGNFPVIVEKLLKQLCFFSNNTKIEIHLITPERFEKIRKTDTVLNHKNISFFTHVNPPSMALLYRHSDILIGAGGISALERCITGTPSITLIIADNQRDGSKYLHKKKATIAIDTIKSEDWEKDLYKAINELSSRYCRLQMSKAAKEICDGHGASRVANALIRESIDCRFASESDAENIWKWRYNEKNHQFYIKSQVPDFSSHLHWIRQKLKYPNTDLLIIKSGKIDIAHTRLDYDVKNPKAAEVSICMNPRFKGRGLSLSALNSTINFARSKECKILLATIHQDNHASLKTFQSANFFETSRLETYIFMRLET